MKKVKVIELDFEAAKNYFFDRHHLTTGNVASELELNAMLNGHMLHLHSNSRLARDITLWLTGRDFEFLQINPTKR